MKHLKLTFLSGIIVFACSINVTHAQTPYYDAIKLRKLIATSGNTWPQSAKDSVAKILANYCRKDEIDKVFFTDNPFIRDFAVTIVNKSGLDGGQTAASLIKGIGGLDVTNLADGIAKFLIKRGKQELGVAFFNKFKEEIDKYKDLKTLFPNTASLLDAIDVEIYNYSAYLQNLRDAFKKDISALPTNFPGVVGNHQSYFDNHTNLKAELLSACYLANELENKTHPGDILANFPDSLLKFTTDSKQSYIKGSVQTLQLISNSLKDTASAEGAAYWVSPKDLGKLTNNDLTFRIYLGLIYQQAISNYANIPFDNDHSLVSFLKTIAPFAQNIEAYKRFIGGFGSRVNELSKTIKNYDNLATDSVKVEEYAKYFKAVVGLIDYSSSISDLPLGPSTIGKTLNKNFHIQFKPYIDLSYHMADLVTDINKKNYSGAVNGAVFIYNEINVKPILSASSVAISSTNGGLTLSPRAKQARNVTVKLSPDSVTSLTIAADTAKKNLTILIKYSGFMAAVATAKNSDEVEHAIEAAALPVGSYSIKQRSAFNISLNAYIGYAFDFNGFVSKGLYAHGVYAPIGFSGSFGLWKKTGGALTLFVSFIDVGGLVSYRLTNGPTDSLKQSIRLESIISPSAQLLFAIPRTPVAVGAGWRMTPKLFYSKNSEFTAAPSRSVFNVSILIDIPIFTLHNEPFK